MSDSQHIFIKFTYQKKYIYQMVSFYDLDERDTNSLQKLNVMGFRLNNIYIFEA
jgi:hypothetical protein